MVTIPGGRSIAGSTPEERAAADDEAPLTGRRHRRPRRGGWFDREEDRHVVERPTFRVDLMPSDQRRLRCRFVADGGAPAPTMDWATWQAQGSRQRWRDEVVRHVWRRGPSAARTRGSPVVLVTWDDAAAYCDPGAARSSVSAAACRRRPRAGGRRRAGSRPQLPLGVTFDPPPQLGGRRAARHPCRWAPTRRPGRSRVLDTAGNVFQWTATPWPPRGARGRA
ncbi:MAG: hypothetical protein HS111_15850 [Kofleriaceae bacterium]|nr:hypothetical protein [Kofleriaceae bacterium]